VAEAESHLGLGTGQGAGQASGGRTSTGRTRRVPLVARGEPVSWLMAASLILCVILIVGLLSLVVAQGFLTFWQRPVERVTLTSGQTFLGLPVSREAFEPSREIAAQIESLRSAGTLPAGSLDSSGRPLRRLFQVGNRDVDQEPFRWVNLYEIASVDRPAWGMQVERDAWGLWLGEPKAILEQREVLVAAGQAVEPQGTAMHEGQSRKVERMVMGTEGDGRQRVRERITLAEGPEATWATLGQLRPEIEETRDRVRALNRDQLGENNARIEEIRRRVREAELDLADAQAGRTQTMSVVMWALVALGLIGTIVTVVVVKRRWSQEKRLSAPVWQRIALTGLCFGMAVLGLKAILERPWQERMTAEKLETIKAEADAERLTLEADGEKIMTSMRALEAENDRFRIVIEAPTSRGPRFAPVRSTLPDEPMKISQLVRAVPANQLSWGEKFSVYVDRWWELLSDEPRESNTEGGVFPVLFGTVMMTILLSVIVVPLGVLAALYMREYAKQGVLISLIRVAVNNLAGVPSIVYGVFGLGFFCYTVGAYVDVGPAEAERLARLEWWGLMAVLALIIVSALAAGWLGTPVPGTEATPTQRWLKTGMGLMWLLTVGLGLWLLATTPYFNGFFRERASATLGTKGLLWGALTLAILTLPVVIVATEEAITAVPKTMREGSYGCGASKWQTIRRIVLPGAMPGIMTGMILAMARGAGEVAPLMLVGAVKLAPELPMSGSFPYVHLERSFMHLGFHIYDLGFQSPDSEAAKPLVWTTTLVLIVVVVLLNLAAVLIRARLRAKLRSNQF
jgi:phosphate transport system permease protein